MTLRVRLLIVIAVLMMTYAITAFLVVSAQRDLLFDQVDTQLMNLPPFEADFHSAGIPPPQPVDTYSQIYVASIGLDNMSEPLVVGSMLDIRPDVAQAANAFNGERGLTTVRAIDSPERFRALVSPTTTGGQVVVAALPLSEVDAAIDRLKRTLLVTGIVLFAVLAALYAWIHQHGLKPIERLTITADAVAAGDLNQRAPIRNPHTEAGKLGLAFNLMLDARDRSDARLRQFIADASHELRTPLTSMRGYLDLYRQGAFRKQDQLDDVMRRMSAESARMNDLVLDLFSLASLDDGRPLSYSQVDLGRVLRDAAQDAGAVQPSRQISVEAPEQGPDICADESLLIQLTGILVNNALTHTPIDTPVSLRVQLQNESASIFVADTGPGLDDDVALQVFDRFWRAETSRQRKTGAARTSGSGLGLSIARAIVVAHGGAITLQTSPGHGCIFQVELPVSQDRCSPSSKASDET